MSLLATPSPQSHTRPYFIIKYPHRSGPNFTMFVSLNDSKTLGPSLCQKNHSGRTQYYQGRIDSTRDHMQHCSHRMSDL